LLEEPQTRERRFWWTWCEAYPGAGGWIFWCPTRLCWGLYCAWKQ